MNRLVILGVIIVIFVALFGALYFASRQGISTESSNQVCTIVNYWHYFPLFNGTAIQEPYTNTTSLSTVTVYSTIASETSGIIVTITGTTLTESGSSPAEYWDETICTYVG